MLEQLRLFLTVVEEGSLHRAAERAHISQSAVTRQMQLLEHDLGGRILERTSTGVHLTTGGHALAQKAKLLLDDYDSTMGDVRRLVRGLSDCTARLNGFGNALSLGTEDVVFSIMGQ